MAFWGSQTTSSGDAFSTQTTSSTGNAAGIFAASPPSTKGSIFGAFAGNVGGAGFGGSAFGSPGTAQSSTFGSPSSTQASSGFGSAARPAFGGAQPTQRTGGGFGGSSAFGAAVQGVPTSAPPMFGSSAAAPVFGAITQSGPTSMFGAGSTQRGSVFCVTQTTPTNSGPMFGHTAPASGSVFGAPSTLSSTFTPATSAWNNPPSTGLAFGAPGTSGSVFGKKFGSQPTSTTGSSMFGDPSATQSNPFQKDPPQYGQSGGFGASKGDLPAYSAPSVFGAGKVQATKHTTGSLPSSGSSAFLSAGFGSSAGPSASMAVGGAGASQSAGSPGAIQSQSTFGENSGAKVINLFGKKSPKVKPVMKSSVFMTPSAVPLPSGHPSTTFAAPGGGGQTTRPSVITGGFGEVGTSKSPTGKYLAPFGSGLRSTMGLSISRKRSLEEPPQIPQVSSSEDRMDESDRKRPSLSHVTESTPPHMEGSALTKPGQTSSPGEAESLGMIQQPGLRVSRARKVSASLAEQAAALQSSSIICHNIPPEFTDREVVKRHFTQFGEVIRTVVNPVKNTVFVTFKTHVEAEMAKINGTVFGKSQTPMKIFFSKRARKSLEKSPNAAKELIMGLLKPKPSIGKQDVRLAPKHRPLARVKTSSRQTGYVGGRITTGRSYPTTSIIARTNDEKLQILEKIDVLLRKQVVKQSDIKKAKTSKGTCPDMCPEKERYLRQQRKLVAAYEMDGDSIDHKKAIKEYSRSSADQEEPLPHELRPAPVLQMSMRYIIAMIIPKLQDGQIADWYDFVWNRTRAIRKELTIQQITDVAAIEINEQCARFHIFCAHHLCEEDRMVFDPKINNENLEKTMKTILDLYRDVYFTPSEEDDPDPSLERSNVAEFYGYYVMLNINRTADVLNELQELHPVVRSSPNIGIAVEAFMAIHSNNYARFFKIVKRASYLQGCILHRYFAQVRKRAALTIAKAFLPGPTKKSVLFPVQDLANLLSFNDMKDLDIFCQHHSIDIHEGDGTVELSRNGLEELDSAMVMMRSDVVMSKIQNQSLSEIIANFRLDLEEHQPYSSFDENGRYIGEYAALLSSESAPESFQGFQQRQEQTQPDEEPRSSTQLPDGVTNNDVRIIAKGLFHEVIDEMCLSLGKEVYSAVCCTFVIEEVLKEAILSLSEGISLEAIKEESQRRKELEMAKMRALEAQKRREILAREEKRKREERELQERLEKERIAQEREEMKQQQGVIIASHLQTDVEDDIIKEVAIATHNEEKANLRQYRIDTWSVNENDDVINDIVRTMVTEICEETKAELKKAKCQEIFLEIQTRKLERCFEKWQRVKAAKIKFLKMKKTFPSVPHTRPISEQIQVLLPNQGRAREERKRSSFPLDAKSEATLRSPMNIVATRKRCKTYTDKAIAKLETLYKAASEPLPFCEIFLKNAPQFQDPQKSAVVEEELWKIAILPPKMPNPIFSWVQKKFLADEEAFHMHNTTATDSKTVSVCCRVVSDGNMRQDLSGAFGVVLPLLPPDSDPKAYWVEARKALEALVSAKPSIPPVCLLILTIGWHTDLERLQSQLGLSMLNFTISNYTCVSLFDGAESMLDNHEHLQEGVEFLAGHTPTPPPLVKQTLREFFECELTTRYISPMYRHVSQRHKCNMFPLEPTYQVEFYNSVVKLLAGATNSEDFSEISWPPLEFCEVSSLVPKLPPKQWNSAETLGSNFEKMMSCQVPPFPDLLEDGATESEIMDIALGYAEKACPGCTTLLFDVKSKVKLECDRIYDIIDLSTENDGEFETSPLKLFQWNPIIDSIISQHLTNVLYQSETGRSLVTHPIDALEGVEQPSGFAELFGESEFYSIDEGRDLESEDDLGAIDHEIERTRNIQSAGDYSPLNRDVESWNETELSETTAVTSERTKIDTSWMKREKEESEIMKMTETFVDQVKVEQKINSEYEARLQAILAEGERPLSWVESSRLSATFLDDGYL